MTDDNAAIRGRLFAAAWRGEEHDLRQILEQNKELVNAQVTNFLTIFFQPIILAQRSGRPRWSVPNFFTCGEAVRS